MENEEKRIILIVDDAPANVQTLNSFLKESYKTKIATNGEKALKIAGGETKPDLILLDIMMPEMDGYEVCRRLKSDPETKQIPVIFLSGKDSLMDEAKGLMLGAVDFIMKPIDATLVKARVRVHLMQLDRWKAREAELLAEISALKDEVNQLQNG
ncbi:response regulator [Magnetococcus sp. PR-3]|uniref:response regulator n=1 Tax=Magnetococcus sp. PR-3 TaxID=3120355 RepID=UPI002FCDF749